MRLLLILCFMLLANSIQAQKSFFVNKEGKKTKVQDGAIDILVTDKRLSYKEIGKTWDKYIRFKDLDYAKWGNYTFKVIRVGKGKKERGFFVQAESNTHKLMTVAITVSSTSGTGFTSSYMLFEVIVTDKDYNIIEDVKFRSVKNDADIRATVGPMIRKYFSDCEAVLADLAAKGESEEGIKDYLTDPEHIKCQ